MIWFKHPNDLPNDKRLASLIDNEGCRGYGMYLRIIEMLCAQPDRKLSFSQLNIISRKGFSRKYMEKIIWEYKLFTIHEEEFESPAHQLRTIWKRLREKSDSKAKQL